MTTHRTKEEILADLNARHLGSIALIDLSQKAITEVLCDIRDLLGMIHVQLGDLNQRLSG